MGNADLLSARPALPGPCLSVGSRDGSWAPGLHLSGGANGSVDCSWQL